MKPTSVLLLAAASAAVFPALAQTAPARTAAHRSASGSARTTAKAAPAGASTCGADASPVLPAAIPKVPGCAKPLYALRYTDTLVGTGAPAQPRKWLTVNYTGYLIDGTKFDSSVGKEPITFPYGAHQVIAGWDTGFEGMNIGGKRRLYIPYELAYGDTGRPPVIPAKATLVFDVELLAISDTAPQPKSSPAGTTPPTGATPPAGTAPAGTTPAKGTSPAPESNKPAGTTTPGEPTSAPKPPTSGTTTDQGKPAPAPASDPTKPVAVPPKP